MYYSFLFIHAEIHFPTSLYVPMLLKRINRAETGIMIFFELL